MCAIVLSNLPDKLGRRWKNGTLFLNDLNSQFSISLILTSRKALPFSIELYDIKFLTKLIELVVIQCPVFGYEMRKIRLHMIQYWFNILVLITGDKLFDLEF